MCQLLTDLLRENGYAVDVAYDGASAIEKYRESLFDLVYRAKPVLSQGEGSQEALAWRMG